MMEQDTLDTLKNIKPVKTSNLLYKKIEERLYNDKGRFVPLYKVIIAATLVMGLFISQLYFINSFSKSQEYGNNRIELIPKNNNLFYYE
ncbi:MAG: hypothetical protein HRT67_07435 [Flavobacteriaceae bacterium]|nr:hypothetical protein [Flavobacteriaceae bacterium]